MHPCLAIKRISSRGNLLPQVNLSVIYSMQKKSVIFIAAAVIISSAMLIGSVQASTMRSSNRNKRNTTVLMHGQAINKPVVVGTVSAISGNTLTVSDNKNIVYTVDVASAKITKKFGMTTQTLTIADVKIGDKVVVNGTVAGTAVTATAVFDGANGKSEAGEREKGFSATTTRGIFGKVTGVNGSTFTVETVGIRSHGWSKTNNVTSTYTVSVASTTVVTKDKKSAIISDLIVGTNVMVRGTVDTVVHTVTATNISIVSSNQKSHFGIGMIKSVIKNGFGRGMMNSAK